MSMIGGIMAAGRQFAHWFGGLALSAKAGIAIAAFATMSAGVFIGVPYTRTSAPWSIPTVGPYETTQTPSPVKPSIVEAATPISSTAASGSRNAGNTTTTSVSNTQAPTPATSTSAGAASSRPATTMAPATTTVPTKADGKPQVTTARQTSSGVYYKNCSEASRSGAAPIASGQPGYRSGLDSNNNGVACE
jgi:hypothetical protein